MEFYTGKKSKVTSTDIKTFYFHLIDSTISKFILNTIKAFHDEFMDKRYQDL